MGDLSHLNIVDIAFLVIFMISVMLGFVRGLISELLSLGTVIAAVFVGIAFSERLANYFTHSQPVQEVVNQTSSAIGVSTAEPVSYVAIGVSFTLLFMTTSMVGVILKFILNIPFQYGLVGVGNRILGAGFGFLRAFVINLVIIFLVQLSPILTMPWWVSSQIVRAYQPSVGWLGATVSPALVGIRAKFNNALQTLNSSIQNVGNSL